MNDYVVSAFRSKYSTMELSDHEAELVSGLASLQAQINILFVNASDAAAARAAIYNVTQVGGQGGGG